MQQASITGLNHTRSTPRKSKAQKNAPGFTVEALRLAELASPSPSAPSKKGKTKKSLAADLEAAAPAPAQPQPTSGARSLPQNSAVDYHARALASSSATHIFEATVLDQRNPAWPPTAIGVFIPNEATPGALCQVDYQGKTHYFHAPENKLGPGLANMFPIDLGLGN